MGIPWTPGYLPARRGAPVRARCGRPIGALRTTLEKPLKVDLHPHQRVAHLVEYRAEDYDVGVGGQLRPHELKHLGEQASDRLGILIAGNVLSTPSIGGIAFGSSRTIPSGCFRMLS